MTGPVVAAEAGDWTACLDALLADWRATRDPDVAACIDRVATIAAAPPVGTKPSILKAVTARIAAATALDVAPIIEVALRQMTTTPTAYRWIVALAKQLAAPDPRIAAALVEVARYAPVTAMRLNSHGWLLGDAIDALAAQGDPRSREELVAAADRIEPSRGRIRKYRAGLDRLVAAAAIMRALPAPISTRIDLAAIDRALVGGARQVKRGGDVRELLAAIYANPGDALLRQIYADALTEAGDPRGEFIALQCARGDGDPPTKRERELLASYARSWLGELDPVVGRSCVVFRRGFLAVAQVRYKYITHEPLLASPAWATIEELEVMHAGPDVRALPMLRRVWGLSYTPLERIDRPVPWTTIGIVQWGADKVERCLSAIEKIAPDLAELDLSAATVPPGVIARQRPIAKRVRVAAPNLRVADESAAFASLCDHALRTGFELEVSDRASFGAMPEGCATRVRSIGAVAEIEVVVHGGKLSTGVACRVIALVARADRPLASVRLVAGPRVARSGPEWDALANAARARGAALV